MTNTKARSGRGGQAGSRTIVVVLSALAVLVAGVIVVAMLVYGSLAGRIVDQAYAGLPEERASIRERVASGELAPDIASDRLIEIWLGIRGDSFDAVAVGAPLPELFVLTSSTDLPNDTAQRDAELPLLLDDLRAVSGIDLGEDVETWRNWIDAKRVEGVYDYESKGEMQR